jgi:CHAT domain-containing protein
MKKIIIPTLALFIVLETNAANAEDIFAPETFKQELSQLDTKKPQKKAKQRDFLSIANDTKIAGDYLSKGQFEKAEPLLIELVNATKNISEKNDLMKSAQVSLFGGNSISLATLYYLQGRYEQAQLTLESALKVLKENKDDITALLIPASNILLAEVYQAQGNYKDAVVILESNLAESKKLYGEKNSLYLTAITPLALTYKKMGQYEKSESLLLNSLAQHKEALGEKDTSTIITVQSLGTVYQAQKQYQKAESFYLKTLELNKQFIAANKDKNLKNFSVEAPTKEMLASLYIEQGFYDKAMPLLEEAIKIRQHSEIGFTSPTLFSMAVLAKLYQEKNIEKAEQIWQQHLRLSNQFLDKALWGAGEKTRLAYMQQQENYVNDYLSFYAFHNAAPEALYFSLNRKGLLLRISSEINAIAKNSNANANIKTVAEKFNDKKKQLANLIFDTKNKTDKSQIKALEEEINQLEMQLSSKVDNFRKNKTEITPQQLLAKLTDNDVVVDFLLYDDNYAKNNADFFNPPPNKAKAHNYKCIALIADKKNGIKLIKLGDLAPINEAIKSYRQSILPNQQGQLANRDSILKPAAQKLYQLLWQPLLPYTQNKKQVYLIPDGILHLLPFKALQDEKGRYLAETQQITLLTSARDIVLPPSAGKNSNSAIFAAPDYGDNAANRPQCVTRAVDLRNVYFCPLESALKEGQEIDKLFKQTKVKTAAPKTFVQAKATESVLTSLRSPKILHIATHGFFLQDTQPDESTLSQNLMSGADAPLPLTNITNPLSRSGLAFSNANLGVKGQKQTDGTDGILTALEVLALNLEGTDLVTLSACETGVGDIQVGEGVYSLNRAFQEAGAKSVLATLWSVADEQTKQFMQEFYSLVLNGTSPQQALQKTQLKFINDKNLKDPFFWAAFTVVGKAE